MQSVDSEFWDQLRVNHERIDELNPDGMIDKLLKRMKSNEREELCKILDIHDVPENDEVFIAKVKENTVFNPKYYLYLKEFISRKKKALDHIYNINFSDEKKQVESSDYLKLVQTFIYRPSLLFEILVNHEWKIKATGDLYQYNKEIPLAAFEKLTSDVNFQKKLIDALYKATGQSTDYKLFAHCELDKEVYVYMLYKKNKDTKKADYDRGKRIKDVDIILFQINQKGKILEIKSTTKSEVNGVVRYFTEQYNLRIREIISDIFDKYEPEKITQVFETGEAYSGVEPADFVINKIVINNSLLTKSPQITIQLSKSDIWLSVVDAFRKNIININSLADIEQIKFTTNNHSRTIRSLTLENGLVIFKLDDSGIDEKIKDSISDKFKSKFGFPLDQPINNKLSYGEARKIDYLLRVSADIILNNELNDALQSLITQEYLELVERSSYECINSVCGYESDDINQFEEGKCPSCNSNYIERKYYEYSPNEQKIVETAIDCFVRNTQLRFLGHSNMKIKSKNYTFYKFLFKKKPIQILVSGDILSKATISHIERLLIPSIIIYYGVDREQALVYTPNTIEFIDFGLLYLNLENLEIERIVNPILKKLEERAFLHISTIASQAHESLKSISGKTIEINDIYDDEQFEDEVFALFKDMIPNSEKWGKEAKGKKIPEGLIDLQFNKVEGNINNLKKNLIFTYDCKLTKNEAGYDLNVGEKRKSVDYVRRLNNLTEVSAYCTTGQISGHIFISNKFRDKQIPHMVSHFYDEFGEQYKVKPIFLEIDELLYIYEIFCKNKDKIMRVLDIYYEQLTKILLSDEDKITKESIDEYFDDVFFAADQYKVADTERITRKLTQR